MANGMVAKKCNNCQIEYSPTSNRQKICVHCNSMKRLKILPCARCGCEFKQANGRNYACVNCRKSIAEELRKENGRLRYKRKKENIPVLLRGFKINFCLNCYANFKPISAAQKYCKFCSASVAKQQNANRKLEKRSEYRATEKAWIERNKTRIQINQRERYSSDLSYRIACSVRSVMRQAFDTSYVQRPRFESVLGIDAESFVEYLVSHDERFTRENYGSFWHVDHIRPIASFDLRDEKQQQQAFHYTNCQPLERFDNLKKSSKWCGKRWRHKMHISGTT